MSEKPNILVTNDDSVFADGIKTLVKYLAEVANVYVCAPDNQKSACGHGITITTPIIAKEIKMEGAIKAWKISGTPADCVKLGLTNLLDKDLKIDLVFSGINHGPNLGTDVLYSGTVSGAIEGIVMGIPAIAISIDSHTPESFDYCGEVAIEIVKDVIGNLDKRTVLNINIPNKPKEKIKGKIVTKLGQREYKEEFLGRQNPFGQTYFWYSGTPVVYENLSNDIDVIAVAEDYVSITPLHYDLTHYKIMNDVKGWFKC